MDITLLNGKVLKGLPENVTQRDVMGMALSQGLAAEDELPVLFPALFGGQGVSSNNEQLEKPELKEEDPDPSFLENAYGLGTDLVAGVSDLGASLVNLAGIPVPKALEKYTTDPLAEGLGNISDAIRGSASEEYQKARAEGFIESDVSTEEALAQFMKGDFSALQAPSWQAVIGTTLSSLPQMPAFVYGGGAALKGLQAVKFFAKNPKLAQFVGYGATNAALVAPTQWRETYSEAIEMGMPEEEAQKSADASAMMTALISGATGGAGGVIGTKMGMESGNLASAVAKGFVAEAPFEGLEEFGQSAATDIGLGRPVDLVKAAEAGGLGALAGGVPGAGVAAVTNASTGPSKVNNEVEEFFRKKLDDRKQLQAQTLSAILQRKGGYEAQPEAGFVRDDPLDVLLKDLREKGEPEDEIQQYKQLWLDLRKAEAEKNDELFEDLTYDRRTWDNDYVDRGILNPEVLQEDGDGYSTLELMVLENERVTTERNIESGRYGSAVAEDMGLKLSDPKAVRRPEVRSLPEEKFNLKVKPVIDAVKKIQKQAGLGDIGVSVLERMEHVVEDANGNLVYGIRRANKQTDTDKSRWYDDGGEFVYADYITEAGAAAGSFDTNLKHIFLSLEEAANMGGTPVEIKNRVLRTFNHEKLHALRMLDLFKKKEWAVLKKTAANRKRIGDDGTETNETYREWAERVYSEQSGYRIEEESVAELIAGETKLSDLGKPKLTGMPRALIERIGRFFEQMYSALKGEGFTNFKSVLGDINEGRIGGRKRGVNRGNVITKELGAGAVAIRANNPLIEEKEEQFDKLFAEEQRSRGLDDQIVSLKSLEGQDSPVNVQRFLIEDFFQDGTRKEKVKALYSDLKGMYETGAKRLGLDLDKSVWDENRIDQRQQRQDELGERRKQKEIQGFSKELSERVNQGVNVAVAAVEEFKNRGEYDGYEVGSRIQGSVSPLKIEGHSVRRLKSRDDPFVMKAMERLGATPTIVEHDGTLFIPMLTYSTADGTKGQLFLDAVKAKEYDKMGGLSVAPRQLRRNQPARPDPDKTFETPDEYSAIKKGIWKVQDKLVGLKDIEGKINEARTANGLEPISFKDSAYRGEERSHGMIGETAKEFREGELQDLVNAMTDGDEQVTMAQLDEFLVLRHAIERNAQIRKVNPNFEGAGAGSLNGQELTDEYVKEQMRTRFGMEWVDGKWKGGENSKLNRIAENHIDPLIKGTLREAQKGGLITDKTYEYLSDPDSGYRYYAPLRGFGTEMLQEVQDGMREGGSGGTGGSMSIMGNQTSRAKGRSSEAFSPLATLVADRERTIARGIKNKEVGQRIFKIANENPNNEVWEVIGPGHPRYEERFDPNYTYIGPKTDELVPGVTKKKDIPEGSDPQHWTKMVKGVSLESVIDANGQQLVGVKVNGEQYYIDIKDDRLRHSMLNLDGQSQNKIVNTLGNVNRVLSAVNTTFNPEFIIGNFFRDIQTAVASIKTEQNIEGGLMDKLKHKKMVKKIANPKALARAGKDFYKAMTGKLDQLPEQEQRDILEFLRSGSKADWFHSLPPEQQHANIQQMMDIANGTFKGNLIQKRNTIKDFVENANAAVENAVRFSAFREARDEFMNAGLSREEAVARASSMAKNMTINFNRKGDSGNLLNSLYLFFNAQVQGTAVILRGLQSPTKQKIMGSIVATGAMMAMLHEFAEDDEDDGLEKVEDYVRERNMVIPIPGSDKDATIPLPYGYNFFYQLGSNAYLMARGKMAPAKAGLELAHTFLGSFSPVGAPAGDNFWGSVQRLATPTAFTPAVEMSINRNYFGSPIYKEDLQFGTPTPDSHRTWKNSNEVLKAIMQGINDITGGNEHESGFVDVSPDTVSYFINYGLGGMGAFAERSFMKPAGNVTKGKMPFEEWNDVPFARRFINEASSRPDMGAYYDHRDQINQKVDHFEAIKGVEKRQYLADNRDYIRFKPAYDMAEKQLRVLRQRQKQVEAAMAKNPDKSFELAERMERIQEKIDEIINKVNKKFAEKVSSY